MPTFKMHCKCACHNMHTRKFEWPYIGNKNMNKDCV